MGEKGGKNTERRKLSYTLKTLFSLGLYCKSKGFNYWSRGANLVKASPSPGDSVGWSIISCTKMIVGSIPCQGVCGKQLIDVSHIKVSLSSPLSKNQ